jgi:hypothetical protein
MIDYYDGPFDPHFKLSKLSRSSLARLGREYMFFNHLHDRSVMTILFKRFGMRARTDVAVDEWRGSSPIYNRRIRKNLKIGGDGVSAVLKALQNDVGAPHHFLDFRYELVNERLGYFWTEYCGAYDCINTLTHGHPDFVRELCHDMEDTTFPSTTMAVNPKAHCLPIHRPPLPEGHTGPICKWEISTSDEHKTLDPTEISRIVGLSKAAQFEFPPITERSSEGMDDYGGPFKPDYELEDLSQAALVRQCKEFMLDVHLLIRACMISIASRWGEEAMKDVAREEWLSAAPVYVERIRKTLRMQGDDMGAILKMLQVDPALPHDYVDFGCKLVNEKRGHFWINECAAVAEGELGGWLTLLSDAQAPGFDAVVEAVNPKACCRPVDAAGLKPEAAKPVYAWEITIQENVQTRDRSKITRPAWTEQLTSFAHRSPRIR